MLYVHENLCENNILQKIAFFLGKGHNNYLSTITQIQLGPQTNKNAHLDHSSIGHYKLTLLFKSLPLKS
jgi:hypothetical protein